MKKIIFVLMMIVSVFSCSNKEKNEITIALDWSPNTNHTGIFVAKEKGYFDKLGLNVKIVEAPEYAAIPLIASNNATIGISFQDALATYFSKEDKAPVTAIATLLQHNTSGLVSLKEKNITSFKDLEGKVYGTWEDPTEQAIIKYLMKIEGASWDKVSIIPYDFDAIKSLKLNTDAIWIFWGWDGIALKQAGLDFNYLEAKQKEELDYYTPVLIANNEYLSNNEKQAKDILSAIKKGYLYAIENPEEAVDILIKNSPELESRRDFLLESQKYLNQNYVDKDIPWGHIDATRWNKFYTWLYENSVIQNPIDKDFGFTNRYLGE